MTCPLSPGDRLDHYRMERLVASSAMAFIFRATDTRTGTPVAVKVPRQRNPRGWFFKSDLERERSIGRQLDHPSIAKMLPNEGESHRYAVMEWVDGRTLREVIREQKTLPVDRAVEIARRMSDALDHIHSRGLVHLDLKPDNVMVDSFDQIKLIDFGIARQARTNLFARIRSRRSGTPDYASPEQIAGKPVDVRSDLYSLGVILYEMLTGEIPFSGVEPATALSLRRLVDPPSVRELNPEIGIELDCIVRLTIARCPTERYGSARDLSRDLARIVGAHSALEFVP